MCETTHLNMKTIELLVCIYEVLGELVFKYGISGCSRSLTLETIMNHHCYRLPYFVTIPQGKALIMGQKLLTFIESSAFKARLEQAEVLKS